MYVYMEIHVHSTLAYRNKKEKKGKVTHPTMYILRILHVYLIRFQCVPYTYGILSRMDGTCPSVIASVRI